LALAASVGLGLQIAAGLPTHGRVRRTGAALATIGALLLLAATLRLRGAGFHAAPYYLWILGAVAACVAGAAGVRSAQIGAALFVVGGVLISPIRGPLLFAWDEPDLRRTLAAMLPTFEYVRDHTTPDQRFLSLNVEPIAYLIARRQPAMPGVFYLPWQAEWERSRREPDSCARVRAAPPPYVYFKPHRVHGRPWESYGSCFDALLLERYERVTDLTTRDLWRLRTEPHSGSSRKATSPPAGGRDEDRG
jgi:hypothetical protein